MNELKEIFVGMLVVIYGIMWYVVGRTNFLEKIVIGKLIDFLENTAETDQEKGGE